MIKKIVGIKFFLFLFIFTSNLTFAAAGENGESTQAASDNFTLPATETNSTEMGDLLRSNGMIYVVVGVILIVLTGLILYLISVDRKLSRLEKEVRERQVK